MQPACHRTLCQAKHSVEDKAARGEEADLREEFLAVCAAYTWEGAPPELPNQLLHAVARMTLAFQRAGYDVQEPWTSQAARRKLQKAGRRRRHRGSSKGPAQP